jgi:hypothetical protein
MPRLFPAFLVVCALTSSSSAWATGPDAGASQVAPAGEAEYRSIVREAITAFEAKRWDEARAAFERAHALRPSARTFRGMGVASSAAGDDVAAIDAFEHALVDDRSALTPEQRAEVSALLDQARSRTASVEVRGSPAVALLRVDGGPPRDPRGLVVLPVGAHVLSLGGDGYVTLERRVDLHGGERLVLDVALAPLTAPPAPSPAVATPTEWGPSAVDPSRGRRPIAMTEPREHVLATRILGLGALGLAPALAVAGAAIWFTGKSKRDEVASECAMLGGCNAAEANARTSAASLRTYETWTDVSLVAAGITAVTGVVLILSASGSGQATPANAFAAGPTTLSVEF